MDKSEGMARKSRQLSEPLKTHPTSPSPQTNYYIHGKLPVPIYRPEWISWLARAHEYIHNLLGVIARSNPKVRVWTSPRSWDLRPRFHWTNRTIHCRPRIKSPTAAWSAVGVEPTTLHPNSCDRWRERVEPLPKRHALLWIHSGISVTKIRGINLSSTDPWGTTVVIDPVRQSSSYIHSHLPAYQ